MRMGFNIKYEQETQDAFALVIKDIEQTAETTEKEMLKLAGEKAKNEIEAQLRRLKRQNIDRSKRPALADDVKMSIKQDKWGGKVVKIQGGKKTGTLWHIVNDGNLHSRPTFFLDAALKNLDNSIDTLWDRIIQSVK